MRWWRSSSASSRGPPTLSMGISRWRRKACTGGVSGSPRSAEGRAWLAPPAVRSTGRCAPSASRPCDGSRSSARRFPILTGSGPATCCIAISPLRLRTGSGSRTSRTCAHGQGRLCRVHRGRVCPADRRLARQHEQEGRTTNDSAEDCALETQERRKSSITGKLYSSQRRRIAILSGSTSRASRARRDRPVDQDCRRRVRHRPDGDGERSLKDRVQSAPPSSTLAPTGPSRTSISRGSGRVDWNNNRRLQGPLGMLTPIEFKLFHYEALNRESPR